MGKKVHPTRGIPTSIADGQYDQEIDRVATTRRKTTFYVFTHWRPNPTMVYRYKVVVDEGGEARVDEMRYGSTPSEPPATQKTRSPNIEREAPVPPTLGALTARRSVA